jgi:hypothetical protein
VNSEAQRRHHKQPAYDPCWPPDLTTGKLLQSTASAYDDEYQSHIGGVRTLAILKLYESTTNYKEEAALHTLHQLRDQ